MKPTKSVSIDITTSGKYIKTTGGGGIKIAIDGDRLNKFVNEDQLRSDFDWHPEYVGMLISSDLWEVIETTTEALEEETIYEEFDIQLIEYVYRILIEPLGEETFRIAFRTKTHAGTDNHPSLVVPSSSCGYPVDMYAWGRAVSEAGEAYRDELAALGHEELASGFDELLSDLEQLL